MATLLDYYTPGQRAKFDIDSSDHTTKFDAGTVSANIGWVPDAEKYANRVEAGQATKSKENVIKDWPTALHGPLTWSAKDLEEDQTYIYDLSRVEIEEIEAALSLTKASFSDFEEITRATFPLPTLAPKLDALSGEIHDGRGFVVLRGLQPESYSREDNVIIYFGLSSYVGGERRGRQTPDGAKLMHIMNVKSAGINVANPLPVYSNEAQPFHADVFSDLIALYYLQVAKQGGETLLASSWTVYNELARTMPKVINTLASSDWAHDTRGCKPAFYNQALLFKQDKKIILNFSRRVLTGSPMRPRSKDIPPLSEAQAEALDAVHFCALKHSIKLQLQRGDMCFVNNLAILHSRFAFQDDEKNTRHALRLWLHNPDRAWPIPEGLRLEWDRTFAPREEMTDHIDIDPFEDKDQGFAMITSVASESSKCFG